MIELQQRTRAEMDRNERKREAAKEVGREGVAAARERAEDAERRCAEMEKQLLAAEQRREKSERQCAEAVKMRDEAMRNLDTLERKREVAEKSRGEAEKRCREMEVANDIAGGKRKEAVLECKSLSDRLARKEAAWEREFEAKEKQVRRPTNALRTLLEVW